MDLKLIKTTDAGGYEKYTVDPENLLLRNLSISEWTKGSNGFRNHYLDRRDTDVSIWVHSGYGGKEFDSFEECKQDLIKQIQDSVKDLLDKQI